MREELSKLICALQSNWRRASTMKVSSDDNELDDTSISYGCGGVAFAFYKFVRLLKHEDQFNKSSDPHDAYFNNMIE